jgi:aspartate 1-decarboxylase
VVTSASLNYMGSITIDAEWMAETGIREYERVLVVVVENGQRFETYVMAGEPGSRVIQLNGAAARLACVGDRVIIMAFAQIDAQAETWEPKILVLDPEAPCEGC